MASNIKWGLIATGAIAQAFARGLKTCETGELYAVASRTQEKADKFAEEFGAQKAYGSYDALLADSDVNAVYISTPHPQHAEWTIKAADAGKHVLVEKPMGVNQYEVQAMLDAAVRNDVFLMEAYMYRCHPQTAKLVEIIRSGAIGDVRVIQATFSFGGVPEKIDPSSRLWTNELAGGGILDVGGYTTSISRLIAGAALDQPFANPTAVTGAAHLHPESGVDCWAIGTLKFDNGIVASISTGVGVGQDNSVRIFGSQGSITLPNPYLTARDGSCDGKILVKARGKDPEESPMPSPVTSFSHEADVVGRALMDGKKESAEMSHADSLGNAQTQDAWRDAIGLVYAFEQPENMTSTISRRPLEVSPDTKMTYGEIKHLDKKVSRLVMGVDNQNTMPHAAMIFDEYFTQGGNTFDTAWVYGQKKSELTGQWVKNRGIRNQVVWIAKGAHTPKCYPNDLLEQFNDQLEWFQTDYADIYLMHRDNPEVPVGEFVDVLNQLVSDGKLKTFGGSNWTMERISAANAYAEKKGLQGFSIVSNNLSLAVMVKAVWFGCLHVHDDEWTTWMCDNGLVLLPWSSQARGFFVPERAHPDKRDEKILVDSWYSDENFQRQARAIEVAEKYGVEPINVALAWVIQQPYPVFPLVGPRTLAELRSTMHVFDVTLTDEEMAYLDLK